MFFLLDMRMKTPTLKKGNIVYIFFFFLHPSFKIKKKKNHKLYFKKLQSRAKVAEGKRMRS